MTGPCPVCGGVEFQQRPILWPALIEAWGLTVYEARYIDRQQGLHCLGCGCNMRAMALAVAFKRAWVGPGDILEVNEAHALSPHLARIPGHVKASWPDVDLRALPYPDASFDVVVHSDTLEHVGAEGGGYLMALSECYRVLRPGGALVFTVPTLVGKLTRSTEGHRASFHDPSEAPDPGLRVHTEFGADVWAFCLEAGFFRVAFTCLEYPAGLAITAWKGA